MFALRCARKLYVLTCLLSLLVGCSNGRGSLEGPETPAAQAGFTLGASVTGLVGSGLVLQNNGGNDLAVSSNGAVTFSVSLSEGATYNVTVLTQPANPAQSCTVANGSGRVAGANVTNVSVSCVTTGTVGSFAVRGTVTGLPGAGLVLRNNGTDDLPLSADGEFSFPTLIATGAAYNVTLAASPPNLTCTIANGTGTMGAADVTNVTVTCSPSAFTIGGTVSGLTGSGLELVNNESDVLRIASNGNGAFVFNLPVASGAAYSVTVRAQPSGQNCVVANPAGTVASANVTDVAVTCSANLFSVGGTVAGLSGSGLALVLNSGNDLLVTRDGPFAFPTLIASGTPYVVAVRTQPSNPSQECTISNSNGVVPNANVTNVTVSCRTNVFSIGGSVQGLSGSGLILQKNGADDLPIASNGNFTFGTEQSSGSPYTVTVSTQPTNPSQTCTVEGGSGTVGSGNVRSVRVRCDTNTFSIGGSVSGLLGQGLRLRNDNDTVEVQSDGGFTFPNRVASGGGYDVRVETQPSNPTQSCSVGSGAGTVANADVTNVTVTCTTSEFAVGGRVRGLAGTGLVLRNNGADDLAITADGNFRFATTVPSGATYSVSVASQPTNPTQSCSIVNASGTIGGGEITNVEVDCVTVGFTVGGSVSGLAGSGLQLQNNGGDTLAIAANGSFTFPTSLTSGTSYNVTVSSQPTNPSQTCSVSAGSGTVTSANVTSVVVTCVTNSFTVGGTVSGLASFGLILHNNGGDPLGVNANGAFTFPTPLPSGSAYSVTIAVQPVFPPQTCNITSGSGTVGAGNVTDIAVTCQ